MLDVNQKTPNYIWSSTVVCAASYKSRITLLSYFLWFLMYAYSTAALANTLPKLHQKMKVMKRKKVEFKSMVDQNVWNISGLRDQKRLALGKGTITVFRTTSLLLVCLSVGQFVLTTLFLRFRC
jgi:hypothetical protein